MWKLWFKNVVKIIVYSIHKAKNVFGTMFQITCFSVWKKRNCVFGMCVCVFLGKKLISTIHFFFLEREKLVYVLSNQVGPIVFNIFTKVSLSNVVWKLKTGKRSFLNSVFIHPKMSNVTQILQ